MSVREPSDPLSHLASDVAGKVVLISGASGTFGRALVEAFASAGARMALCGRDAAALQELVLRLYERGAAALAVPADIRQEDDVIRMVHRVVQRFGRIDVVINAVAVTGPRAALVDYPTDPWRDVIATNLTGTYLICREVLPWMARQGGGSIVNVTTGADDRPDAAWGALAASECAVAGMTRMLAAEVKDQGVRVNIVELARVRSRRGAHRADGSGARSEHDSRLDAFLWLASPASAEVTGQRIDSAEFARTGRRAN